MTGDPNNLSCQEFQERLADLIGSGEDAACHPHILTCANCRAFLAWRSRSLPLSATCGIRRTLID